MAATLELMHLTFTGNKSRTLAVCQDKHMAKAILSSYNLPTSPSQLLSSKDQVLEVRFPVIIKPNAEDASLGIGPNSVVSDPERLAVQVKRVLDLYKQPALVEEYIEGREFNVAVMENKTVQALPVSEIDFSQVPESMPHICSYEAKWLKDHVMYQTTPPVCPAPIDDALKEKLQQLAVDAFRALGCRDYARVDFRMDEAGNIYILEINPNPDISLDAGYARALNAAGIEYSRFWKYMIDNALQRKKSHGSPDGPSDKPAVMDLIKATDMFTSAEIKVAEELIDAFLLRPDQKDYYVVVVETPEGGVGGYLTWGPTPLAEGAYDLYWMAVSPNQQKRSLGKELVRWLERTVADLDGRLIIIETAGQPKYHPTRQFYLGLGYKEVARVPDFYKRGDDRIIYTKHIPS